MSKQILVNSNHYETRVALLENGEIKQLHIEREEDKNVVGNVYLGVVKRVLPGMQAAFLELGLERTAFLYVDDIIDEPFGSDVEVFDEEETESEETEGYEEPSLREGESRPEQDATSEEDTEVVVIEEDASSAPIFVAPSIQSEELSEDEASEEGESEEDEEGDDFEGPISYPDNEPDFELTDVETEAETKIEETKIEEPKVESRQVEEVKAKEPQIEAKEDLPPFEPMPTDLRSAPIEEVEAPYVEEDEGPQPGNEKGPSENQDQSPRDRQPGPRRRDYRDNRRGRGGYRHARGGGRGPERQDTAERQDRPDRHDRSGRRPEHREDRDRDRDRGGDRDRDRGGDRERSASPRGPRRNDRRYESRDGRSSRQRPRYGNRNNRRRGFSRRRRSSANIQDLLKEGQEILVQVAKAPIGTKGARLTTHISLPGRNLVLMPTVKHLGISRRIESDRERRRLRDIFTKRLRVKGVGFIIRTVAEGKSFRELKADADYLIHTWQQIKKNSAERKAPALIHEDLSLTYRTVRDYFTEDVDSLVIDNSVDHDGVQDFIGKFMPQLKSRVKLFKGPSQLFEHYGIEAEISRALSKKVWLKSGGYLLIDQSEALTAIDVNTGRYVGSKSLEETILRTNLEAVKEIAYQLRIRNVGGIIIIDLIDMESSHNREKVFNALQDALSGDKSKTNILKISELGLVEMTRKRTHEDLIRYLTESCPQCDGRGYTKSRRTVAFEIFREIEKEALSQTQNIVVFASPGVVSLLSKDESRHVGLLEKRFGKTILIKPDPAFHTEQFEVFGKH